MARVVGLGHIGIYVQELEKMVAFYRDFLGMQVTKQNWEAGAVFLSSDPARSDHEIALMRGRPSAEDPHLINQISMRVVSLADLREMYRAIKAHGYGDRRTEMLQDLAVLTGGEDKVSRLWDVTTGQLRWQRPQPAIIRAVAFNPTGKSVLIGYWDGPEGKEGAQLLEAATGKPIGPALPQADDLTFGQNAGKVLVGLTVRPAQPGPNTLLLYVVPPEGPAAAADVPLSLTLDGEGVALDTCSRTCRSCVPIALALSATRRRGCSAWCCGDPWGRV